MSKEVLSRSPAGHVQDSSAGNRRAPGRSPATGKLSPSAAPVQRKADSAAAGPSVRSAGDWVSDSLMDAAHRGAAPAGVVQRQVADGQQAGAAPAAQDDPFQVDRGQLTFDAEGTEGGRYHTRRAHWPGGASGVTIGRGYDLGHHSRQQIITDMTGAGVSASDAALFAAAAGLTGTGARDWLASHRGSLPEITPEQQEALFGTVYGRLAGDVERISGNYAQTMSERTGESRESLEIDWNTVHPAIRDVLVDLRYRGDYTPTTRRRVQQPAIDNDINALYEVMRDRAYWVQGRGVPEDRFNRRVQYLEAAISGNQGQGQQEQGQGQTQQGQGQTQQGQGQTQQGQGQTQQGQGQGQTQGNAGPETDYRVTASSLNVRSSPDASSTNNRIGALARDEQVKGRAVSGGWVQITYRGQQAYVSASYLAVVQPEERPVEQFTVTASSLNVRSSPDSSSNENRIGSLSRGARVSGRPAGDGWVQIDFNGQPAYVSAAYVTSGSQTQGPTQDTGQESQQPESNTPQSTQLSGANWVQIANSNGWVNNNAFSSLDSTWGPKAEAFVTGLRNAGATVTMKAGLRHPKRAYLMHYAWGVANGDYTPQQANAACQGQGIAINWDHGSASKSRAAANALKQAFGLVHQASLTSNHIRGKAIDIVISNLPASISMNGKTYTTRRGASGAAAARSASPIGRDMGVIWFGDGDYVHWSHTGR